MFEIDSMGNCLVPDVWNQRPQKLPGSSLLKHNQKCPLSDQKNALYVPIFNKAGSLIPRQKCRWIQSNASRKKKQNLSATNFTTMLML
jgi:hypothetical protein